MTTSRAPKPADDRSKSDGSEDWYTPAPIVAACAYGLTAPGMPPGIDLDPYSCATANRTVNAARFIDREEDGLRADWGGARRIFSNVPFGAGIELYLEAIAEHVQRQRAFALVIVPPNVDATWWHTYVCGVSGTALLLEGRVGFMRPVGEGLDGEVNLEVVKGNMKGTAIVAFAANSTIQLEMLRRVRSALGNGSIARLEPPENAIRRDAKAALAGYRGQGILGLETA